MNRLVDLYHFRQGKDVTTWWSPHFLQYPRGTLQHFTLLWSLYQGMSFNLLYQLTSLAVSGLSGIYPRQACI
jgi:hypothetical protein